MTVHTLTIPTEQIKAHVQRIVSKNDLTLKTETIDDAPLSPFVGRHEVRTAAGQIVVAAAFRPGDDDEAFVEIWKAFVRWGIV